MADTHLVYSKDDNGWYWERYADWWCSQLFTSRDAALQAMQDDRVIYRDFADPDMAEEQQAFSKLYDFRQ